MSGDHFISVLLLILLGLPGGGELLAGGVDRVGSTLTVGVGLGARVMLGGDRMVQTLHAAP